MDRREKYQALSPFLNVFKDGQLVDSFGLYSRDFCVLGRHTNCHVLLTHPSISRHHLQIQLLHETKEALLTDMDSVHGTWVEGKQISSLVPYKIKAGEVFKLGASSRTYTVDWLQPSRPASSSARATTTVEAVDSKLLNTGTMIYDCSSKSANACIESKNNVCPSPAIRKIDRRDSCDEAKAEKRPSPGINQKTETLYSSEEVAPTGCSANSVKGLNTSAVLQSSKLPLQKEGLPPLPPASRRIPFAPLPQNAAFPVIQKKTKPAEKKLINGAEKPEPDCATKLRTKTEENVLKRSRPWLRRCNSAPSPVLNKTTSDCQQLYFQDKPSTTFQESLPGEPNATIHDSSLKMDRKNFGDLKSQSSKVKLSSQQSSAEEVEPALEDTVCFPQKTIIASTDQDNACQLVACSHYMDKAAINDDEYPSDKENEDPLFNAGIHPKEMKKRVDIKRKPFQPLIVMPNDFFRSSLPCLSYVSGRDDQCFLTGSHSRPSSLVENLDHILPKLRGVVQSEPHYTWHMVVDSTCLLDLESFNSLKRLEGIKEVRIIIPQIVIREMECLRLKDKRQTLSNAVLKWIEACMLKNPSWIHVQSLSENLHVGAATPPASPHYVRPCASGLGDLMSPTNSDHVLNCALVFSTAVVDGHVALLTNDAALKIKAMAEGIVCDGATSFCESLLSPYSDRFLWAGSVARHAPQGSCLSRVLEYSYRTVGETNRRMSFMPTAYRSMGSGKKYHAAEKLRNYFKQGQGLRVILG